MKVKRMDEGEVPRERESVVHRRGMSEAPDVVFIFEIYPPIKMFNEKDHRMGTAADVGLIENDGDDGDGFSGGDGFSSHQSLLPSKRFISEKIV